MSTCAFEPGYPIVNCYCYAYMSFVAADFPAPHTHSAVDAANASLRLPPALASISCVDTSGNSKLSMQR